MKRFVSLIILCAMLVSAFAVGVSAQDEDLVDSGINYTETTQAFGNPMVGYPSCPAVYLKLAGNTVPTKAGGVDIDYGGFIHFFIDMRMFSGGYTVNENGEIVPLTPEQTADRVKCDFNGFWAWNNGKRNQGGPEDRLLNDDAINMLRAMFQRVRDNGGTCLVRPEYAIDADEHNEPSDFNVLLAHVEQLSAIFTEYSDVIGGVEVGTIGPFGEMHTSPYCAAKYANRIVKTYMDSTPKSIKFMVRNPEHLLNYVCGEDGQSVKGRTYLKNGERVNVALSGPKGIVNLLPFDNLRDVSQEDLKRLSLYNDGYMLTWGDTGTWKFMSRSEGVKWLEWAAFYGYYGGEYGSGERPEDDIWLPENALPEMYKTHVSYIHGNIYKSTMGSVCTWRTKKPSLAAAKQYVADLVAASKTINTADSSSAVLDPNTAIYVHPDAKEIKDKDNNPIRDQYGNRTFESYYQEGETGECLIIFSKIGYDQIPFTEKLAKMSTTADVSAYYGRSVYSFMRDHLGYRFVVRSSKLSKQIDRGGVLCIKASIENTGFGNCVQDKVSQLIVAKDGKEVACIDLDSRVNANEWYTQRTSDFMFECRLTDKLEPGKYDAYLRICNVTHTGEPSIKSNVRFANDDIYSKSLGANYLGSFTIGQNRALFATETSAQVATRFTDVPDTHWAKANIAEICTAGYMGGTSNTTFAPEVNTARGMLVQVLYNIEGRPDVSGITNPFNDVKPGDWYYNAVLWASSKEIVNGTGDGKFSPTANLNREQFATMIYRYAQFKGADTSARGNFAPYIDAGKVSDWAQTEFSWAVGSGLIGGMSANTLAPQGFATRAQMATILKRYLAK